MTMTHMQIELNLIKLEHQFNDAITTIYNKIELNNRISGAYGTVFGFEYLNEVLTDGAIQIDRYIGSPTKLLILRSYPHIKEDIGYFYNKYTICSIQIASVDGHKHRLIYDYDNVNLNWYNQDKLAFYMHDFVREIVSTAHSLSLRDELNKSLKAPQTQHRKPKV